MTESSASSLRSVSTSTGSQSKHPSTLLFAPKFLTCAGAILFRGIHPLPSLESLKPASATAEVSSCHFTNRYTNGNSTGVNLRLQVCLIYHQKKKEYILAKGRKDQFEEGLLSTALRETFEETGYPCRPFPVLMQTRAPVPGADIKDVKEGLAVLNCVEPFALTIRNIETDSNVKTIYWFIAEVTTDSAEEGTRMLSEVHFQSCWFDADEACDRLTYEHDREVVRKAISLVRAELTRRREKTDG